jgi:hypothetical protein
MARQKREQAQKSHMLMEVLSGSVESLQEGPSPRGPNVAASSAPSLLMQLRQLGEDVRTLQEAAGDLERRAASALGPNSEEEQREVLAALSRASGALSCPRGDNAAFTAAANGSRVGGRAGGAFLERHSHGGRRNATVSRIRTLADFGPLERMKFGIQHLNLAASRELSDPEEAASEGDCYGCNYPNQCKDGVCHCQPEFTGKECTEPIDKQGNVARSHGTLSRSCASWRSWQASS